MTKLLKLAWRDIWRNRRRSLLTMGAIVFAVVIISLANSVQYGTYDAMEELVVRVYTSDLQVHRAGFQEEFSRPANRRNGSPDVKTDNRHYFYSGNAQSIQFFKRQQNSSFY